MIEDVTFLTIYRRFYCPNEGRLLEMLNQQLNQIKYRQQLILAGDLNSLNENQKSGQSNRKI